MGTLSINDQISLGIVLIAIAVLIIGLIRSRKLSSEEFRGEDSYQFVHMLMHESAERGQKLLIGLGDGIVSGTPGLSGWYGLPLQKLLAQHSIFNDFPAQTISGDGSLACLSQMVAYGVYDGAVSLELLKSEQAMVSTVGPNAYLASFLPEISQKNNSAVILAGHLTPEFFLALDLADQKRLPTVATSDSLAAQAAFFAAPVVTSIGEDVYNPTAFINGHKQGKASLLAQDWLRILIISALLIGSALKLMGLLP